MLGSIILAGACVAIAATGATAGPGVWLGELAPVEVVEWTGAEPFASVFANRDRPVVLRATRYAAESPTRRWTVEHLAKMIPGGVLENAKRYPAAPGAPMFATVMPMATVPELMAHYAPHFSRHDLPLQQFFDHIGVSPEAVPGSDGDGDGDGNGDPNDVPEIDYADAETPLGTCDMADGCTAAETAKSAGAETAEAGAAGGPADSVFASSAPASVRPRFSYAGMLREWGPWLEKDLELDGLVPTVTGDAITVKPYVWMGQGGTVTPCHYDYYQNFYLQLQGQKHFAIFPPAAHAALYLHPAVHPAHRSSQLSFPDFPRPANSAPPAPKSDGGGGGGGGVVDGWEVVLEPGDILFLPAMYFHHVTTLGKFALSTNVWSEYTPLSHHGESLQVQLPFVADLAGSEREDFVDDEHGALKAQIMRAYINLVLEDMLSNLTTALAGGHPGDDGSGDEGGNRDGDEGRDADDRGDGGDSDASTTGNTWVAQGGIQRWIKHHLLDRRHKWYSHAVVVDDLNSAESPTSHSSDGAWPRFCNDPDFLAGFVSDDGGFALHMLQATVQEVESIITEIQSTLDAARFEIIMLNWVERVATDVVGPRYVAQFLSDLAHC